MTAEKEDETGAPGCIAELPCVPQSVGRTRVLVSSVLADWGLEDNLIDCATIVVSELVTNAVLHSGGKKAGFEMVLRNGDLYVAVRNDSPTVRLPTCAATVDDEHGRGLQLVDSMVRNHGGTWQIEADGATVSCTLPVSEGFQCHQ